MLCTQVINGLSSALGVLSLNPGQDFEIVTVSFDPKDTPATATAKKARLPRALPAAQAPPRRWHFLTGDQPSIDRLTEGRRLPLRLGRRTRSSSRTRPASSSLTPDGTLSRYLFGIEYGPRDLRFALVEASAGKVGTPVDALLLYCYHYDPMTGRYGLAIMRAIRMAGAATVLAHRRVHRRHGPPGAARAAPRA